MFDPMFTVSCSTPAELPAPRERVVRRVLDGCGPAFWGWPYDPMLVQPVRLARTGVAAPQMWTTAETAPAPVSVTECGICGSPVAKIETTYDRPDPWGDDRVYINPRPKRYDVLSPCGHTTSSPRQPSNVPLFAWASIREQDVPVEESVPALVDWLTVWAAWYYRAATTGAWDVADFARPPALFDIDMTGPAVLLDVWKDSPDA